MSEHESKRDRQRLRAVAQRVMLERDFVPDYSPAVLAEVGKLEGPAAAAGARSLADLGWCSIDNDDSLDLDQLSAAEELPNGRLRLLVAIADVDALVAKDSAIDRHARHNTTSVYTPGRVFAMLPERLSTDLTSLNEGEERRAVVVDMTLDHDGRIVDTEVYRAMVRNRVKLAYHAVGAWLEERGPLPVALADHPDIARSLQLQDRAAQQLREQRHDLGALELATLQLHVRFADEAIEDIEEQSRDRAKELIEELMIAANGVTARFLRDRKQPALRRVVRSPERWQRLVELAAEFAEELPAAPDSLALNGFLKRRHVADPLRFPDLSLTVIKLLGRGEYAVVPPDQDGPGHFGLAVKDYTHSTAPNRRYPDLITQRQVKACLADAKAPYTGTELEALARRCTSKENDADKVERLTQKAAAACLLQHRIGERFEAVVTGASDKGTWVRILRPPVEGKLVRGWDGLDVGQRVRVKLVATDIDRGYIDFRRA